jgi:hypothetical protein
VIQITGTLVNAEYDSTTFKLTVLNVEDIFIWANALSQSIYYYKYTDLAGSVSFDQFTENSAVQSQSDIAYTMSVTSSVASLNTDFITFTRDDVVLSLSVRWNTTDVREVATISISVTGSLTNTEGTVFNNSVKFTLIT